MTFGKAITAAKHGYRIKREGWNGKDQYVELATAISYINSNGEIVNAQHDDIGSTAFALSVPVAFSSAGLPLRPICSLMTG